MVWLTAMVEQPSGTVTLVFTDIEGSTRLLQELGRDDYLAALAEHRRIIRSACAGHAGYEVDYEGDQFFYAFASAGEAVAAVEQAMHELEAGPVGVRVGVHTGEPGLDPPKYVGIDVHLAARVMAAGHGGQVLLTQTTRDLLEIEFKDLGEHRLKDFDESIGLYQLGDRQFPPLRTLSNTNLPSYPASFLGRERELGEVLALLRRPHVRELTLTGPGGTGKTRLAITAAAELVPEFAGGVFWVSLGALRDPELVLPEIARTLTTGGGGVRSPLEVLKTWLSNKRVLLLLDNFEQVLEAAPSVAELLSVAPQLRIVVTSRSPLRIVGEQEYPVPPLADAEAAELFVTRTQAVRPDFRLTNENALVISAICARLDGLPLALELAAPRLRLLSPQELLARLTEPLDVLIDGARDQPMRQRTLRGTIEWSYRLLSCEEQALFRALAVFAGGCTLEAIEAVFTSAPALEPLTVLVESSLVLRREGVEGDLRFSMLETVREYADEQLVASGVESDIRTRHAGHYLDLAESFDRALIGADPGFPDAYARLDAEQDNIRAALTWYADHDNEKLVRLVEAAWHLWYEQANLEEGEHWFTLALARSEHERSPLRARLLQRAVAFPSLRGDHERQRELIEASLALNRQLGDETGITGGLRLLALALQGLGELERARTLAEEALDHARKTQDEREISLSLVTVGLCFAREARLAEARATLEDALRRFRELQWHPFMVGQLVIVAAVQLRQGDLTEARANFKQALAEARHYRGYEAADALLGLAAIEARDGNAPQAARWLAASEKMFTETGRTVQDFLPALPEARDEVRSAVDAHLGAVEFERIAREVGAMSLDQVIDEALATTAEVAKPEHHMSGPR